MRFLLRTGGSRKRRRWPCDVLYFTPAQEKGRGLLMHTSAKKKRQPTPTLGSYVVFTRTEVVRTYIGTVGTYKTIGSESLIPL